MTNEALRLAGTTVLITGGTRGIGRAAVEKFAIEGANVVFSYLSSEDTAKALEQDAHPGSGAIVAQRADVRDRTDVDRFIRHAHDRFGRIDVIVNNAHAPYERKLFEETSWDDFQRELDTLVKGAFNMAQSVLPIFKAQGGGQVINVSSTMAQNPEPLHSFYSTAKNALTGLTRALALELGPYGVRVNIVSPGPLVTDHNAGFSEDLWRDLANDTPLHGRVGTCEEVAGAIMLLTLPEAGFVTGTVVQVSGGHALS